MSETTTTEHDASVDEVDGVHSDIIVTALDLTMTGDRGAVYGPLSIEIPRGSLTVLQGAQGSGRSSLLLTLAGRMKHSSGELTVAEHRLSGRGGSHQRRLTQRAVAISGFTGIDELDNSVTVAQSIRERQIWLSPWYRNPPKLTPREYLTVAGPVFGARTPPALDSRVWDLDEVDTLLLRIMIALLQDPEILVVDDLDQVHDSGRRQYIWTQLESLTKGDLTVIASVASVDEVTRMTWTDTPSIISVDQPNKTSTHSRHGRK